MQTLNDNLMWVSSKTDCGRGRGGEGEGVG